jgi:hypothetical protein
VTESSSLVGTLEPDLPERQVRLDRLLPVSKFCSNTHDRCLVDAVFQFDNTRTMVHKYGYSALMM